MGWVCPPSRPLWTPLDARGSGNRGLQHQYFTAALLSGNQSSCNFYKARRALLTCRAIESPDTESARAPALLGTGNIQEHNGPDTPTMPPGRGQIARSRLHSIHPRCADTSQSPAEQKDKHGRLRKRSVPLVRPCENFIGVWISNFHEEAPEGSYEAL